MVVTSVKTSVYNVNSHMVVEVNDNLDIYNASEFKQTLFDLIDKGYRSIIVDMQAITFLDSSVISTLIVCHRRLHNHVSLPGKLTLVNLTDNVETIFQLSSLNNFFNYGDTLESVPYIF